MLKKLLLPYLIIVVLLETIRSSIGKEMRAKWLIGVVTVTLLNGMLLAPKATATILFEETFESYAAGSNLIGQGGWTGTNPILIGDVAAFSSRAADGRQNPGIHDMAYASHSLNAPLDPNEITWMTFDALAVSQSPSSHNSGVFFEAVTHDGFGWFVDWTIPGWHFDARGLVGSGGIISVTGGYDVPVQLGLVVDGPANEIYGFYNFGAGVQFTPHFSILPTQISNIDELEMFMDYRGSLGAAFDNIQVSTEPIPEPTTIVLMGFGILGLVGVVIRQYRNQKKR